MRIAMFSDCWHPIINGVVTSMDVLRRRLLAAGHEVEMFVPAKPGCRDHDPSVHRFFSVTVPIHRESRFTLPYPWSHIRRLQQVRPDVLHIHTPFNLGLLGLCVSDRLRIPYVFTHHTLWEEYVHYVPLLSRRFLRKTAISICRQMCNRSSAVIAPSEEVRERLLAQDVRRPIHVIPTGIETEQFLEGNPDRVREGLGLGPDEPLAIFAGRMGKEKSIDFVLRAFVRVREKVPRARLLMIGGGPEKRALEELARSLGLLANDTVIFTGYVPRPDLVDYLKAARVFLFASTTETQGLVSLEAQASGCPVVAVRASGSSEAVAHEETGFLVPPQNIEAFASETCRLLTDDALRARMAMQAVHRAQSFSAQEMAERTVSVYRDAQLHGCPGSRKAS